MDFQEINKYSRKYLDISFSRNIEDHLLREGFTKTIPAADPRPYYFKDNGAKILGVAHIDTFVKDYYQDYTFDTKEGLLHSYAVDDRMGVYTLLYVLQKFGVEYDILLSTDEEKVDSTSRHFTTEKQYNWMFEFDRTGDDVVMYQYLEPRFIAIFNEMNLVCSHGSYSDISDLEHLKCRGFNFGTGYYDYHSKLAYVDLYVYREQIMKFCKFYEKYKDEYFDYAPTPKTTEERSFGGYGIFSRYPSFSYKKPSYFDDL